MQQSPHPSARQRTQPAAKVGLSTKQRLLGALAALTTAGGVIGALLLTFHQASPPVWLAPTPELMELASGCDLQPERAARDRCLQDLVLAQVAREKQPVRVAAR